MYVYYLNCWSPSELRISTVDNNRVFKKLVTLQETLLQGYFCCGFLVISEHFSELRPFVLRLDLDQ